VIDGGAGREDVALAFREDPLDVVPGLAGADLALLFPTALALRERPGTDAADAWRSSRIGQKR